MQLYDDTTRRPAQPPSRAPSNTPTPDAPAPDSGEPGEPADIADIDLERALWDMEYRRQVLEILRRGRCSEGEPPSGPASDDPERGKKGG